MACFLIQQYNKKQRGERMKTPILEMKHIRKTFASTVALGDVDLNVYPGEIRGLIGENGSGKSTISSIAAGMQKADSGEMLFHGKSLEPWQHDRSSGRRGRHDRTGERDHSGRVCR